MSLPMQIQPSATPFSIACDTVELQPLEVARVVKTIDAFTRLLAQPNALPDGATLMRYASALVGLHKRLLEGATVLSKDAVERYARKPGAGAERRAREELMRQLEAAYQAVEPLVPNEVCS